MNIIDTFRHGGTGRQLIRGFVPFNLRRDARNIYSGGFGQKLAGAAGVAGAALNLPEWGVSERGGNSTPYKTVGFKDAPSDGGQENTGDPSIMDQNNPNYTGGGGARTASTYDPRIGDYRADQNAYYDDQIANLMRLLGRVDLQRATGQRNIGTQYDTNKVDLNNRRLRDMNAYADQDIENVQDRERGINAVDSFVNTSYRSLQRLLGSAGAGNSSAARTVVPTLVSNAGGARRTGVMDTFAENRRDIDAARIDATNQYNDADADLDKWKEEQEYNLLTKAEQEKLGLLDERKGYETSRELIQDDEYLQSLIDSGQARIGYREARDAGANTQAEIEARMAALDQLFGNFNPTYAPRTIATQRPELSRYTVNSGRIQQGSTPGESLPYLPFLKKRKQTV